VFAGDWTRELHLALLAQTVDDFEWKCHAYCQMDNHFHLVVQTPEGNLSEGMQFLNGTYAQAFNRDQGRSGHLFQGRFHSVLIEWEGQLRESERYTVLNRVRAKACSRPEDWKWSSYPASAGLVPRPAFLTVDVTLAPFGDPRDRATRARYRAFIAEGTQAVSHRGLMSEFDKRGRQLA
jgi:REP element-mobilizing transposase RayT